MVVNHDGWPSCRFDRTTGSWTVGRFLADVQLRYGGVDSVLLWHSYPNIGVHLGTCPRSYATTTHFVV